MNRIRTCLLAGVVNLLPMSTIAQIVPDGSTSTTVNTNGNVSTIEAGEQAGGNLFHSFSDFSVINGSEAYFNNGSDIERIFSRVTGGNISNIDGLIRANGSASLFLVNPAGVIFNDGARLDIGGSFYGTTSDSILFPDGVEFNSTEAVAPVLTINAPIGLNFRDNPGEIAVNGSNLRVSSGQSINLIGGDVSFDGGSLSVAEGTVNLGSIATAGTVTLTAEGLDFNNLALADISLSNGATINVNQGNGGTINVSARNLTLSDRSIFNGGIDSAVSTSDSQAGNVTINVSETLALESGSLIRNNLSGQSSGNAGDIEITAGNLTVEDESRVVTIAQGSGNTGNIFLDVTESINLNQGEIKSEVAPNVVGNAGDITLDTGNLSLAAESLIFSNISGTGDAGSINIIASDRIVLDNSNLQARVESGGVGNSGDIEITTGSLSLTNSTEGIIDSGILASTAGQGNAGNINLEATTISLTGSTSIQTQVQPGGMGTGGDIQITTDNISFTGNSPDSLSSLLANSSGNGDAGNIFINAAGSVTSNQHALILSQATVGQGNAGNVTIESDRLKLNTGSFILSNTGNAESPDVNTVGNAGNINIDSRVVELDNFSQISNNVLANADGLAGNINIINADLTIAGGSNINALTENNSSSGGSITIDAQNVELVTGGKIVTGTNSGGNAGNITLNLSDQLTIDGENAPIPTEDFRFREVTLQNLESQTGLFANTTAAASGNSGSIIINNADSISLVNSGEIAVDSQGTGNGGNLTINADSLSLENQSQLIAETQSAQPEQSPSNIILQIDDTVTLKGDSKISAQAFTNANGGNVTIETGFVIAFPAEIDGNDIVANASEGSGGNINITAEEIFGLQEGESIVGNMTNDLDVSSEFGFDGSLSLNTPDVDTTGGVTDLSVGAIATGDEVKQACSANSVDNSSLSLKGRGNIPTEPTSVLSSDYLFSADQVTQTSQNNPQNTDLEEEAQPIITAQGKIYPARGLKVTEAGAIILTRLPNQSSKQSAPNIASGCLVN